MGDKSLDKALDIKVKGNELFKQNDFEKAIELYTEAINTCPPHRQVELAVIYQNRAAANERLEKYEAGLKDCDQSIKLNNRYGKSLDRRSKIHKKIAIALSGDENITKKIEHLKQSMEDVSMVAQLEGYKHEQLLFVDEVLKHLGSALAVVAAKKRDPTLPSSHTIIQYFTSFMDDPLFDCIEGDGPYAKAKKSYEANEFEKIIPFCDEEITVNGPYTLKAKLLKATFLVLTKQLEEALKLLSTVIEEAGDETKVKVNALVKRGALYIQRCHDPQSDATMSYADFNLAADLDPTSADVLMNRGQINLLLDNFQAAVDDLAKASELRPDFALANVQKLYTDFLAAQIANDAKRIDEIVENFKLAVDKYPSCVEVYALYAKVLQETADIDGADEMYKKGSELNPDNANLIVHRALLALQKTGDVESTMSEINRAIKVDEKCEFAFETIGQIEIQRDNMEAAVEAFDKAIPLVNTELEMAHLFGLRESAYAKMVSKRKLQELPTGMQDMGLD
eukprot:TRINITY_DN7568_c0_g1_i1.p1 TRINITY_DN7568_c0_g1~~TRINITY_DN7568_c0_g1_i1.p1  ORF type:complete len:527 (-),score=139.62 TRINITY_DN7568_c0_g1_i1:104-1630(-)